MEQNRHAETSGLFVVKVTVTCQHLVYTNWRVSPCRTLNQMTLTFVGIVLAMMEYGSGHYFVFTVDRFPPYEDIRAHICPPINEAKQFDENIHMWTAVQQWFRTKKSSEN